MKVKRIVMFLLAIVLPVFLGRAMCSKIARHAVMHTQDGQATAQAPPPDSAGSAANSSLATAVQSQAHERWVVGTGRVSKILKDDNKGSKHQRFIVRWASGKTVLVAHNIDLAPRVPVAVGDTVEFRGSYVWNAKGGLVHFTHRKNGASAGWINHKGNVYQ